MEPRSYFSHISNKTFNVLNIANFPNAVQAAQIEQCSTLLYEVDSLFCTQPSLNYSQRVSKWHINHVNVLHLRCDVSLYKNFINTLSLLLDLHFHFIPKVFDSSVVDHFHNSIWI